jgi:hypothetical protein
MSPFAKRDAQLADLIRREIAEAKERAQLCGWKPSMTAWHRAFGEISGMHRVLQLIDREADDVMPPLENSRIR